jgi:hypothetical protein
MIQDLLWTKLWGWITTNLVALLALAVAIVNPLLLCQKEEE